jgi:hypothetical protein
MSLIWMFRRNWNRIFDIKDEFLFDDLEWFFCHCALYYSFQTIVNILRCRIKSYYSFIILRNRKRCIGISRKCLFFLCRPIPSLCSYFRFYHGKIFIGYRLIVSERREMMRQEFSPFTSRTHMFYYLTTQCLILLDRVGYIEDTVFGFFERRTPKKMLTPMTVIEIKAISAIPSIGTESSISCRKRTQAFVTPLTAKSCVITIIFIFTPSSCTGIAETFSF